MSGDAPYKVTAWFDRETLPAGLRRAHSTKAGVWGVVRVGAGRVRLTLLDVGREAVLDPALAGVVAPGQLHLVELETAETRMRVEFVDAPPTLDLLRSAVDADAPLEAEPSLHHTRRP